MDGGRCRAGQPLRQHPLRVDDAARRCDVDPPSWQGHRAGWKISDMNTGTLVASLIVAAVLVVLIGLVVQAIVRGWRHRAERQGEPIRTPPPVPDTGPHVNVSPI